MIKCVKLMMVAGIVFQSNSINAMFRLGKLSMSHLAPARGFSKSSKLDGNVVELVAIRAWIKAIDNGKDDFKKPASLFKKAADFYDQEGKLQEAKDCMAAYKDLSEISVVKDK